MVFEFFLGGYFNDHNYTIRLIDYTLSVSDNQYLPVAESEKKISVTNNESWLQVLAFLKNCGWKRTYESGILDGTQWTLKLKGNGSNLKCYGSNAYPENFGEFIQLLNKALSPVEVTVEYYPINSKKL
jgi:hypothetical protein